VSDARTPRSSTRAIWLRLALALAALGASYWYLAQPPSLVAAARVHDLAPQNPSPRLILAVIYQNRRSAPVEIVGDPTLRVRSVGTGGQQNVRADRVEVGKRVRIAPGQRVEVVYDLWQLTNLYDAGFFRDLRDAPSHMRFRLGYETDDGAGESDEWPGVTSGSDAEAMLTDLRGGIGV